MSIKPEVVDFEEFSLEKETCPEDVKGALAEQFISALEHGGCLYLINTGIAQEKIQTANETLERFFRLPEKKKKEYIRKPTDAHGYSKIFQERFPDNSRDAKQMEDYRESFDISPWYKQPEKKWPDDVLPEFRANTTDLIHSLCDLSFRCLELCALALGLKDKKFFVNHHHFGDTDGKPNPSTLRGLHYPPNPSDDGISPGTERITGHSDADLLSFLIHDSSNNYGFQVQTADGVWRDVDAVPGAILVICGHTMRHWTADRIGAIKHRVIWPTELSLQKQTRRSLVFFLHPDDDVIISCIDGSNTFEPISSVDLIWKYLTGTLAENKETVTVGGGQ